MSQPRFPDLNEETIRQYRRDLPHWEATGGAYFVTFRLADSLPQSFRELVPNLSARLKSAEGRGDQVDVKVAKKAYFHALEHQLDRSYGKCPLRVPEVAAIVQEELLAGDVTLYDLFAWCVMPNHVHAVVCPEPKISLAEIVRRWKGRSARFANLAMGNSGRFWLPERFDHLIRSPSSFDRIVQYVLDNPRKAGLPEWPFLGTKPVATETRAAWESTG